ncbi:MAG TPA: recombinase family protein [Feifaniaceae bacterium]|nr:recombinase family protein [Feifaniaceae bacterium]
MSGAHTKEGPPPRVWNAALYVRLSREDGGDVSLSVQNQSQRLLAYLQEKREELLFAGLYVDDGFTGTDTNRAAFQRMLLDIRARRVNCVVVKDLSRLSRNYIEAGHYMEHLFVELDVRFISLELPALDSFRAPEMMNSMLVPLQNVINDDFCRQTSIKVRSVLQNKRKSGEFTGAFAPYGYQKDPRNKHRLIIDGEAADVVRSIFRWYALDGMSKRGVAKRLNGTGVPNPAQYKKERGLNYRNPHAAENDGLWSAATVANILKNPTYLGHMVQGRSRVKSYKVHTQVRVPRAEWTEVKNTHAPIVNEALFRQAQERNAGNTKTAPRKDAAPPFSGLVRCAGCNKAMTRRVSKGHAYYACRTYREKSACSRHSIREDALADAVRAAVRALLAGAWSAEESGVFKRDAHTPSPRAHRKRLEQELQKSLRALDGLYADYRSGEFSREEYLRMKNSFRERAARAQTAMERLDEEIREEQAGLEKKRAFLNSLAEPEKGALPDRGLLVTLIRAVYVQEDGGVCIAFRCADPFRFNRE